MESESKEAKISLGIWKKGNSHISIELVNNRVFITPVVGNPFFIHIDEWPARQALIEDEGWVRVDLEELNESDFVAPAENSEVRASARPTFQMEKGYEASYVSIPSPPLVPSNIGDLPADMLEEQRTVTVPPFEFDIPDDMFARMIIPADAVLRRKDGKLFLMMRKDSGWESFSFPVEGDEDFAIEKFNIRLGIWNVDEHGEFCTVTKVFHKIVRKPPRPDKTG